MNKPIPVYYFSDCVAQHDESVMRIMMQYDMVSAAMGINISMRMMGVSGSSSAEVAHQVMTCLASLGFVGEKCGVVAQSQIIAVNAAPRMSTNKPHAEANKLCHAVIKDPVAQVRHHLIGYDIYLLQYFAPYIQTLETIDGFTHLPALKDLSKGSQFRSLEYLPYTHLQLLSTNGEGIPNSITTPIDPTTIMSPWEDLQPNQMMYVGRDKFGNGRMVSAYDTLEELMKTMNITENDRLKITGKDTEILVKPAVSLTECGGEKALWNSSNKIFGGSDHYKTVLNIGQVWDTRGFIGVPQWVENLTIGEIMMIEKVK